MGLNDVTSGERTHISFFGRRNAGKSSLVNAITGQQLSIVSDELGTTTDPVSKAMEILPLGPVVIIDTPGFDDEGKLGQLRIEKAKKVLGRTDIAVLVADASIGLTACDNELISVFKEKNIPYIIVYNKNDIQNDSHACNKNEICVSALTGDGINDLKEMLGGINASIKSKTTYIVRDLIQKDDIIILVIPVDESAPKGRIILPQQNVLREVLDSNASAICVQDTEYAAVLKSLAKKPALVITDSQAFRQVAEATPQDIPLISFSILMARYKGFLSEALKGVSAIKALQDGSTVLISEGCTHHRQCNDIGTVKLPRLLKSFTGKSLNIKTTSGNNFPEDLSGIDLIIHCGACMINQREMQSRIKTAVSQNVPITNYGTAIAYFTGILKRSLEILPDYLDLLS